MTGYFLLRLWWPKATSVPPTTSMTDPTPTKEPSKSRACRWHYFAAQQTFGVASGGQPWDNYIGADTRFNCGTNKRLGRTAKFRHRFPSTEH